VLDLAERLGDPQGFGALAECLGAGGRSRWRRAPDCPSRRRGERVAGGDRRSLSAAMKTRRERWVDPVREADPDAFERGVAEGAATCARRPGDAGGASADRLRAHASGAPEARRSSRPMGWCSAVDDQRMTTKASTSDRRPAGGSVHPDTDGVRAARRPLVVEVDDAGDGGGGVEVTRRHSRAIDRDGGRAAVRGSRSDPGDVATVNVKVAVLPAVLDVSS